MIGEYLLLSNLLSEDFPEWTIILQGRNRQHEFRGTNMLCISKYHKLWEDLYSCQYNQYFTSLSEREVLCWFWLMTILLHLFILIILFHFIFLRIGATQPVSRKLLWRRLSCHMSVNHVQRTWDGLSICQYRGRTAVPELTNKPRDSPHSQLTLTQNN